MYTTEVIRYHGQWRGFDDVEYARWNGVPWFNTHRLLTPLGYLPPAEFEAQYHRTRTAHTAASALND